jgi:hypothetical protein
MYEAIVEYKKQCEEAAAAGRPNPQIPNYVGECITLIANRLSMKPCFANYSYREEMIGDGIENSICYFDNFDPSFSSNPFSYFTQIIYFAFLRRLQRERKQSYIKHKVAERHMIDGDMFTTMVNDDGHDVKVTGNTDNMNDFIRDFEDDLKEKREKNKKRLQRDEQAEVDNEGSDSW